MEAVLNPNSKAPAKDAYSRVLLTSFHGCRCPNELLRGSNAAKMAQSLMAAANAAGLGVEGDAKVTLFGASEEEQMHSGPTIEFVLRASGFAIDFWPEGELTMQSGEIVLGVGHGNLHYCNRDKNFDREAREFIRIVQHEVLGAEFVDTQGPFDMLVNRSMP